jgi:hypothetical protein
LQAVEEAAARLTTGRTCEMPLAGHHPSLLLRRRAEYLAWPQANRSSAGLGDVPPVILIDAASV